jgi:hypothetical protein
VDKLEETGTLYVRRVTLILPELPGVCARLQKGQLLIHRPVLYVNSPVILVIVVVKEGVLRVPPQRMSFLHPVLDSKKELVQIILKTEQNIC